MDLKSLLEKLKLTESFVLDLSNRKDFSLENLRKITDSDSTYFSTEFEKSNKKYIGNVGKDFFQLKPKNNKSYPKLNVSANGKIKSNSKLEVEVSGFDKKWTSSFLILFPIFAIIVLWRDLTLGSVIFLCIGFAFLSFFQIQVMRHSKKKFKEQLIKDLDLK